SLEEHLGFPLFDRLPRSLRLTEMGRAYLPAVRKAFGELSASTVGLFGMRGEVSVTVRASISFADQWLAHHIGEFTSAYPDIGLRLYTANWIDKLMADKVDVDIRYGDGNWDGEAAERLYPEEVVVVCSPGYVDKHGAITSLQSLSEHRLIHVMGVEDSWEEMFRANDIHFMDRPNSMKVDNSLLAKSLAQAGQGVAFLYRSFVSRDLERGDLIIPIDFEWTSSFSHYVVLPDARTRPRPEVLLFRDWLMKSVRSES
ncbi:MAG: LysR substrate-binding domain-containing protein, partial [Alphaproteobacteria bacterium]|nr:LysR substrate-binding domain-containing protein [Alphaproteobacteria bacterium]